MAKKAERLISLNNADGVLLDGLLGAFLRSSRLGIPVVHFIASGIDIGAQPPTASLNFIASAMARSDSAAICRHPPDS